MAACVFPTPTRRRISATGAWAVALNPYFGPLAWMPNPRLSSAYRATRKLTFTAGGGVYGQPPAVEEFEPGLRQSNLASSSAIHASAGVSYKLTGTLVMEVVDSTSASMTWWHAVACLRARGPVAGAKAGSAAVMADRCCCGKSWPRGSLAGSATRSAAANARTARTATGACSTMTRRTCSRCWPVMKSSHGFQAGARFRYTTGMPRTPVAGAYFNTTSQQGEPIFGAQKLDPAFPRFTRWTCGSRRAFVSGASNSTSSPTCRCQQSEKSEEIHLQCRLQSAQLYRGLPVLPVVGLRMEF